MPPSAPSTPQSWLAVSVQSSTCSVALGDASGARAVATLDDASNSPGRAVAGVAGQRSKHALRLIDEVLREADVSPAALHGHCIAIGPGAFTALRVGVSLVQGLALAHHKPVLGVVSHAALAVDACRRIARRPDGACAPGAGPERGRVAAQDARIVLTAIDARMNECYFAAWWSAGTPTAEAAPPRPLMLLAPVVGTASQAVSAFSRLLDVWLADGDEQPTWLAAGDAFDAHDVLRDWAERARGPGAVTVERVESAAPSAVGVLGAALGHAARPPRLRAAAPGDEPLRLSGGGTLRSLRDDPPVRCDAAGLQPLYVRDKVALDIAEQGALAAARRQAPVARQA
ncbi:MAG: tRNA (adenosine(37)-N6)-threonylcarbamoyltransferase complex dimerization subunit type 1 TsaB [Lautropia sp.]